MNIGDKVVAVAGTQKGRIGEVVERPKFASVDWDCWVTFGGLNPLPFGYMKEELVKYDESD